MEIDLSSLVGFIVVVFFLSIGTFGSVHYITVLSTGEKKNKIFVCVCVCWLTEQNEMAVIMPNVGDDKG
jgi:hypothetical protein